LALVQQNHAAAYDVFKEIEIGRDVNSLFKQQDTRVASAKEIDGGIVLRIGAAKDIWRLGYHTTSSFFVQKSHNEFAN